MEEMLKKLGFGVCWFDMWGESKSYFLPAATQYYFYRDALLACPSKYSNSNMQSYLKALFSYKIWYVK